MSEATVTPATGGIPLSAPSTSLNAPNVAPPVSSSPSTPSDWTSEMAPDVKGYVQNKGWRNPSDLLDSYRGFEKLHGVPETQIVKIPTGEDKDAWNGIFNKLGRPATPDGYNIKTPEGGSEPFTKWAQSTFHEAGLSSKQAELVMGKFQEFSKAQTEQSTKDYTAGVEKQSNDLKKEWGGAYDQNVKLAQTAYRELNLPEGAIEGIEKALGFSATMKLFELIGQKVGEAKYMVGDRNPMGAMTPEAARAKFADLRGDPAWVRSYTNGDANAKAELDRLQRYMHPELYT